MSTLYSSGKVTAYGAAVDAGYAGTYAQFAQAQADLPTEVATLQGMSASASTLAAGSDATASYDHSTGVLSLGIPQGIPGDVANLAPAFSASDSYSVGDYVIYNSQLYKCTTPITTPESWTAAHWTAAVLGDDVSDLKSAFNNIIDTRNLFLGSTLVQNKSYGTSPSDNNTYSYFEVSVTSGTKYIFNSTCRFISKAGNVLAQNIQPGGNYTVDFTGILYVTVYNDVSTYGEWAMCVDGVDIGTISTYQQYTLSEKILAQNSGISKRMAMSQKATTAAIATAKSEAIANITEQVDTIRNDNNIFNNSPLTRNKYYYTKEDPSDNYSYFEVAVTNGTTYKFACRQRYISKAGTIISQNGQIGGSYTADFTGILYVTVYNSKNTGEKWAMTTSDKNVFACGDYQEYTLTEYIIGQSKGDDKSKVPSQYLMEERFKENGFELSKGFMRDSNDLSTGEKLELTVTNCKKNNTYSFHADITAFTSIKIGHGTNTYDSAYITIDGTNLTINNYTTSLATESYAHGLNIASYVDVLIQVHDGTADISIFSNGEEYKKTGVTWYGDTSAEYYAECTNGTLTNCVFAWSSGDFRKSLWAFGDSYFSFTNPARWTYYLEANGYLGNVMLSAFPGENSTDATIGLDGAKNYGKPKMLIWALGMNDGADTGDTPVNRWKTGIDSVLAYCEANYIIPILCTIPSVPSINHEAKNSFVRSSGYRYIDFAKAVGAQSDGTWYTGMLSGDNVHPTERGAKALYYRAIMDCPELTFCE